MELYIYDRNINPLGIVEKFSSLQWQRWFYKSGEFELVCPLNANNLSLLKEDNIIWIKGDPEAAFINYKYLSADETGQETINCKGLFLTGYLKRRIIWDSLFLSGNTETILRQLVDTNAITPALSSRKIPLLSLGAFMGSTAINAYQSPADGRENLADVCERLSVAAEIGHRVTFDPYAKALSFIVWKGLDRTAGQGVNPRAIFAKEYENVLSQEYTTSKNDYINTCLVSGKFTYQVTETKTDSRGDTTIETKDVDERVCVTVGSAAGLDRYEAFISSGNTSKTGSEYISQDDFLSNLAYDGSTELSQHPITMTFDSKINIYGNLKYKKDWDLGDKVTFLSRQWSAQVDTRITGIKEIYENKGMSLDVTFGNDVPTLLDKIKKAVK